MTSSIRGRTLKARSKAPRVAIIAVVRKLLVLANAMIQQTP